MSLDHHDLEISQFNGQFTDVLYYDKLISQSAL